MVRVGLGINNCRTVDDILTNVGLAEELGAEVAFISEDINCRDAFELTAVAATRTSRIRLGTGVVNPYTRNPTSLAMAIATLDEISGGRAILGMGTSSPTLIQEQMGMVHGNPVVVMREATEIIRALLAGAPVSYPGQRFAYREATLEARPVQPHIPIYFAAMGPKTLRLAGQLADGVLLNVGASLEYVRWAIGQIRQGAAAIGRDMAEFTVAAWLAVYIGKDRQRNVQRARELLATMLSVPRQGELLLEHSGIDLSLLPKIRAHRSAYPHRGNQAAAAEHIPPEVAERLTIMGTAEEVRLRIDQYSQAGVRLPVVGPAALRAILG